MLTGVFGVAIHIIFLYSIFDIYFKSPIIHGMTPHSVPVSAPAKRLALFVGDGLRADKLFEVNDEGKSKSPFLRDIVINQGTWGVSHTRIPTESRPGHAALAGGIYEDVSAVTRGWQENPVDFDTVFNESRYTWAWGSPDILPMFSKGTLRQNVFIDTYSAEEEDFAAADPSHHDVWVFDKFKKFLSDAKKNSTLTKMMSEGKVIFFFHLLGLDVSGHSYKPWSREYDKNVEIVDKGVEKCVDLLEDFFHRDEKTSYIFTSDHGMTDWGSHGAGDPQETHTPIVAWGAGIRGPLGEGKDVYHDGYSESWKLTHIKRVDINQVDITPLIATLIGIPFPINSLGILPVEYLDTDWPHKAVALLTNARQVLAHYKMRKKIKQDNTLKIFFWNFKDLSTSRQAELMTMIETLLRQSRYRDAIQVGLKLIEIALKGLVYYHKYDRLTLSFSIFLGFLGWMSYLIAVIFRDYTSVERYSSPHTIIFSEEVSSFVKTTFIFACIGSLVFGLLYVQNAPTMYYAYFFLPVLLWYLVSLRFNTFVRAQQFIWWNSCTLQFIVLFLLGLIGLELMVISYFKRHLLSVILWGFAIWPLFTSLKKTHKILVALWSVTCLMMSVFPFLPVVGRDSHYNLVVLSGWLSVLGIAFCARRPETGLIYNSRQSKKEPQQVVFVTALQVILLCISTYTVKSTAYSIENKEGLPIFNQIISWITLASSLILPLFGSMYIFTRLLNIMTSMLASYILMCISHEGLFCVCLCLLMFMWLCMEHCIADNYIKLQDMVFESSPTHLYRKGNYHLTLDDLRRAYFFIFFILLSFFGTGNIASINSFEPSSVYCFLTVFSPFIMGFLMLLKIIIPFVIVSCSLRAILITLRCSPNALFLLILLMSDFMALHFFFFVQDSGSWLEIGTSISHYIINMTVIIFIALLYGLAWLLTSFSLDCRSLQRKRHKR